MSPMPAQTERTFWDRVDVQGEDECWRWLGSTNKQGYGWSSWKGFTKQAHRLAYELAGKTPNNAPVVRHVCDNPGCCNPLHLLGGTQKDNARDMRRRGRTPVGEDRHSSKLKVDQVREIRSSKESGSALARRFGVSDVLIGKVRRREIWKEVE